MSQGFSEFGMGLDTSRRFSIPIVNKPVQGDSNIVRLKYYHCYCVGTRKRILFRVLLFILVYQIETNRIVLSEIVQLLNK